MFWKCCAYVESKCEFKRCAGDDSLQTQWQNIAVAASQTSRTEIIVLHYYKGICPNFQAMACKIKIQNNGIDTN